MDIEQEHSKKLLDKESIKEKLDLFNARTLIWHNEEKIVYFFDYNKADSGRGEIINRHVLRRLKDRNQWQLIRHPLVLNYVNEKIMQCSTFYTIQILLYFVFLLLLYTYSLNHNSVTLHILITVLVLLFIFFLVIKVALRVQDLYSPTSSRLSIWFLLSSIFNGITYFITILYVWGIYGNTFDNYESNTKQTIQWFLPIVAVISAWINCLYILRKSPLGIYILMMAKILSTFANTMVIWVPTLFCFSFSFQIIMQKSGLTPWDDPKNSNNQTSVWMIIFNSFTKTSAMMIGEVEANDIISQNTWVANILLIGFEIITVIIIMNLMISLAVGDVHYLRMIAEERLLKIKVNFCIELLHHSEQITCLRQCGIPILHRTPTNNLLVVYKNEDRSFSKFIQGMRARYFPDPQRTASESTKSEKVYRLVPNNLSELKLRKEELSGLFTFATDQQEVTFRLAEANPSGILPMTNPENFKELEELADDESAYKKYQHWLLGLNWKALLITIT